MGRSYTPKYAFRTFDMMGRSFPAAWRGAPTQANVKKYFEAFNRSVLPGGVNAHLGKMATAKRIEVYKQSDKQIVASWPPLKNPPNNKYYRRALKVATFLHKHFKKNGVPKWLVAKISPSIRPMVVSILDYNGVAIKNPPLSRERKENIQNLRRLSHYGGHDTFGLQVRNEARKTLKAYIRFLKTKE